MNTEVTAQRRGECGKHWPKRQLAYIILVEVQFCFTSTETVRTIRDGNLDFHTAPELWRIIVQVQCCFTSTETVRTIRDQDGHLDFHTVPGLGDLYSKRAKQ